VRDKNEAGTADKDEVDTAKVTGEDDLVVLFLSKSNEPEQGTVTLSAVSAGSGRNRLRQKHLA